MRIQNNDPAKSPAQGEHERRNEGVFEQIVFMVLDRKQKDMSEHSYYGAYKIATNGQNYEFLQRQAMGKPQGLHMR